MPLPQVQFSRSVISDSLRPHESQHARPLCPSPTPRVHPNPCPLSQWCHPTISSSVAPFSSCPQPFPASGSFQISSSHQVAKVLEFQLHISPSNENPGLISFRMDWLDLLPQEHYFNWLTREMIKSERIAKIWNTSLTRGVKFMGDTLMVSYGKKLFVWQISSLLLTLFYPLSS